MTNRGGIILTVAAKLTGATLAFLTKHVELGICLVILALTAGCTLYFFRLLFLKQVESQDILHSIFHELRDDVPILLLKNGSNRGKKLKEINRRVVQQIASYYRKLKRDADINCAIRLAHTKDGVVQYVTVARSEGLDPIRKRLAKPIPAKKGLAAALRSVDSQGCYLIPSIKAAKEAGLWGDGDPTDDLKDVSALMVTPINGSDGRQRTMVGILFITSKNGVFKPTDTYSAKALADALGLVYSMTIIKQGRT